MADISGIKELAHTLNLMNVYNGSIDLTNEKISNLDYLYNILKQEVDIRRGNKKKAIQKGSHIPINKVFDDAGITQGMRWQLHKIEELDYSKTNEKIMIVGDVAPEDWGENVRREICLTLEKMGIRPESSHHEEGPGQNEIDFRYADALTAADNAMTFQRVVKTIAHRNGLTADFSPKPIPSAPGNGFHINMSLRQLESESMLSHMIAGILKNARAMTAFLNPCEASYQRLGQHKAPLYVSWSPENRSQLIRIPAAVGEYRRAELRSPDPTANPYLAFALMIYAALDGITNKLELCAPPDMNLNTADARTLTSYEKLPTSLEEAREVAASSDFIKAHVPEELLSLYCKK